MPKATVAQRQRMTDSLEENMVYMCVFVSSVRDAWYKLTASCEDAALRRNKYTFAAALFVLQKITVLGRLLGSLRRMARLLKSFCKRHKQIYTNAALGRCYTYTYSHTWLLYDIIADIGSVDRVLHKNGIYEPYWIYNLQLYLRRCWSSKAHEWNFREGP